MIAARSIGLYPDPVVSIEAVYMNISIVTAVYNRSSTIADTLDSVQSQTAPNVEHVIQDGGSRDGTLEIIQASAGPGVRVESAPDNGIYHAINRGITRADGDIIGLLHSDDLFAAPDVLEAVRHAFDQDVDGVYGDLDYVAASDPGRIIRRWRSGSYAPDKLKRGWMPPHPTLFLRREVFDAWGLYDESFRISADYDAMLRWLLKGDVRLAYIPQVLVKMRVGGASNRSIAQIIRKSKEDYQAIRRNGAGGLGTLALKNLTKLHQFIPGDR